jgi:hypothetical protein
MLREEGRDESRIGGSTEEKGFFCVPFYVSLVFLFKPLE